MTAVIEAPQAAHTSETPKVQVPTWAALKTAYKSAETSGKKAQRRAYDAIVRAFSLTSESGTDKKGTVVARSERERGREVIDAFKIEAGNVFGLSEVRIGQIVKVYGAIGRSGIDPFSDRGQALYAGFETIRRTDLDSLGKASTAVKAAKAGEESKALTAQVEAAKAIAKEKRDAKGTTPKAVTVKDLAQVQAIAESMLPVVRKASATADAKEKAAVRKALEARLAHL